MELGFRVALIDDLGNRERYPATVVINGNFYGKTIEYPRHARAKFLLGPKFALIRDEFLCTWKRKNNPPCIARKILVTTGGSDPTGLTGTVLKALGMIDDISFDIKVLLGPAAPWDNKLNDLISGTRHHFTFIHGSNDMPSLMSWADMAITAGGSTCLEMAFMGLPFLVASIADNQEMVVDWLLSNKMASKLRRAEEGNAAKMAYSIKNLAVDMDRRYKYTERLIKTVDGKGAERVVNYLQKG